MEARGYKVEVVRVAWEGMGWIRAWRRLWQGSREWKGKWVLVQYTALMWSRRGLPLAFLGILIILKARGVQLVTIFHDVAPYPGRRMVDRIRRACQVGVLRRAYGWAQASVLPVPTDQVSWLPRAATKASFIPVGPNVPPITRAGYGKTPRNCHSERSEESGPVLFQENTQSEILRCAQDDNRGAFSRSLRVDRFPRNGNGPKTIAVFVVTDGGDISQEVAAITQAARTASQHVRQVRLLTLGRGSRESEAAFRNALAGSSVDYQALGILSAEAVSKVLAECDLSLFVRGRITTQRGSAIAAIACGLPLVGYADGCLSGPLAEAGVVGVPPGNRQALAEAVLTVLTNDRLWLELHERSQRAYDKYFSWEAIAGRFVELLGDA